MNVGARVCEMARFRWIILHCVDVFLFVWCVVFFFNNNDRDLKMMIQKKMLFNFYIKNLLKKRTINK